MKSYIYGILFLIMTPLCFISCEDAGQQCYETIDVKTNSYFNQRTTKDSTFNVPPDSTKIDSVYITYKDTLLPASRMIALDVEKQLFFNNASNKLSVSLNPDTGSLRYQLQFDTAVSAYDTITLFYRPNLHFISNACGYTYFYTVDSVHFTTNSLDSMTLVEKNVTNEASKNNILFYFFP